VDIFQLHNPITMDGAPPAFTVAQVLDQAVPVLQRLREAGKLRWYGITGLGDAAALEAVLDEGGFATAQMPYNLLNPSGVSPRTEMADAPDLGGVIRHAHARDVGVIAIRILAGGALSGSERRNPLGVANVEPIASGASYAADVAAARRLLPIIDGGHARDLVELALRFAISPAEISTVLIGTSTVEELDHAVAAVNKGALPETTLARLAAT
jgi:L-galactose dehydrogenase/L-glyceraldehyde 3-phosphate reductase